jgi:hypothetical protein
MRYVTLRITLDHHDPVNSPPGTEALHEQDNPRGVFAGHVEKLRDILARLDAARTVADMDLPGFRLHRLRGRWRVFTLWSFAPTGG